MRSYLPVAGAMKMVQKKEYESIACGGFSGGCDMLLRAIAFTSVCCDQIILQALRIFCGSEDDDCLPMAKQLYEATKWGKCNVKFTVQENNRHQFPEKMYTILH